MNERTRNAKASWPGRSMQLIAVLILSACGGADSDDGGPSDPPVLSIADVSIAEGDSGVSDLLFTITASVAAGVAIDVDYATSDGTAVSPDDYAQTSGTVSVPAGATTAVIAVPIAGDTGVESDETFTLTLSTSSPSAVIGNATVTGTIVNDDSAAIPTLSISDASAAEGDSGATTLSFTVALSAAAGDDVTFNYATSDGSATSPDDFAAISSSALITVGNTAATVDVAIAADTDDEANETFTVTLSDVSPVATLGTATATGTILNDDAAVTAGRPLNDTGFTLCTSESGYDQACDDPGAGTDQYPGQDAQNGRDATNNDDSDGHAGFSFTKLDSNGDPLADQAAPYGQTPWDCVRDEVTGLTWEVKTADSGLRDIRWRYSWYNSSRVNDDGNAGVSGGGADTECLDTGRCDTEKFIEDVNASGLCGINDWRLPTRGELLSLMDFSADYQPEVAGWKTAFIDSAYFPNTNLEKAYWSSSSSSFQGKRVVAFDGGPSRSGFALQGLSVRLVRGGSQ